MDYQWVRYVDPSGEFRTERFAVPMMPVTTCYAPNVMPMYNVPAMEFLQASKVVNNRCLYCRSVHQANKCPNCGGNEYE